MQKQQNPLSGQVDFKTLTKLTNLYQIGIADIIIRRKEEIKKLRRNRLIEICMYNQGQRTKTVLKAVDTVGSYSK